jgi:hypothetical protein
MQNPDLRLECLKLAYEIDLPVEEVVRRAELFVGFISSNLGSRERHEDIPHKYPE